MAVDDDVGGLLLRQLRAGDLRRHGLGRRRDVRRVRREDEGRRERALEGGRVQLAAGVRGRHRQAGGAGRHRGVARGAAHRGGDPVDQLRYDARGVVELEREALVQAPAGDVVDDPLADPAPAAVGARALERHVEIGGEPALAGGQHEGPAVGVHGQRPAARRHCALLEPGPSGVDAEPADVHAADAHAGGEAVAVGLVVDVGGRQRARHEDEEDAPGQERRANPKPAPRRETAALANRRAHAIRVPHRAACRGEWPARAIQTAVRRDDPAGRSWRTDARA